MIPSLLADSITPNIDRAVHYALLWGLEGLELRTVGKANDRVPFVNEAKIRARLDASELPVVAVAPAIFEGSIDDHTAHLNDVAQFQETLQFCRRLACDRVVVAGFRVDDHSPGVSAESMSVAAATLKRIGEQAARAGISICVLNEVGHAVDTGRRLREMLDAVDHPGVQAAWDPVEALKAGEDPDEGLQHLLGQVGLVRCRNAARGGNGWEPRSIDSGEIRWPGQIETLHASGFEGPISLVVDAEPRPKVGLRDATTLIHWIRRFRST